MELKNRWVVGNSGQWIFSTYDNHSLMELAEKVETDLIAYPGNNNITNLGIHRYNGQIYSSNYVGVCRLKGVNGKNLLSKDGKEVILKIEPRFPISVVEMLNSIKDDDEFERYLAPQTIRISTLEKDVDDLEKNEIFHFFDKEQPIYIKDNITRDSSVLTSTVFISMLKDLCRRPLMGKMISTEENLVGKVKGKVVFNKNIKANTVKGRSDRLYCKYLRYSEDIVENQVLKAALKKATQFLNYYFGNTPSKENSYKEMITYCQNSLNHVSLIKITQRDINGIKTTGCYAYYKSVISVAKMVLNEITLESNGDSKLTSYVVPYAVSMSKLFEIYVRAYLKKAGIKSYADETSGIHMMKYDYKSKVFDHSDALTANYIGGIMKPDIILQDSDTCKYLVFDVKYKNMFNGSSARSDRLQLLAYALMYNCDDVGIIFPATMDGQSCFYGKNKIASAESRNRYYQQIELNIKKEWDTVITSKKDGSRIETFEYVSNLM